MRLNRNWLIGLAFAAFIGFTAVGQITGHLAPTVAQAEPPIAIPTALPERQATPPTATPKVRPTASASPTPSATIVPAIPTVPLAPISPVPVVPIVPASLAPPSPVSGDYKDPNGRFKIAILKDYAVSPLAGSALIESSDGNLAYTVLVRSQGELALQNDNATFVNDALAKIAQTAFQQGEGFQVGQWQAIPSGIKLDWTGSLTIAGKSQPVSGVILVRQLPKDVAMILIVATETGTGQVPGAVSALVDSLQPL